MWLLQKGISRAGIRSSPTELRYVMNNIRTKSRRTAWRTDHDYVDDIPKNVIEPYITAHKQSQMGAVYDCKPFKMTLYKDKLYSWCSCGWGHNQPMCDNTHRAHTLPITMKPVFFKVEETKEYWLCNCKQTKHRPFCDGSHRSKEIEDACKNKIVCTGS